MGDDVLRGLLGHAVLDVHADVIGDRGVLDELPGREVAAAWSGRVGRVREIGIEALVLRFVMVRWLEVVSEVPFAEVRGRVAGFLEGFGEREVIGLQAGDAVGDEEAGVRAFLGQLLVLRNGFGNRAGGVDFCGLSTSLGTLCKTVDPYGSTICTRGISLGPSRLVTATEPGCSSRIPMRPVLP
ncbi:MAG: hypothetical protein EBY07_15305 [Actinobacteria bacterium]|nr:hypothetical protein [Actinomycetota bacterium]